MGKRIKHMGMSMTTEEHERWHKKHGEMTPSQHQELMKKIGISDEEDKEWHRKHDLSPKPLSTSKKQQINPFAVGGGFLDYCVKQGWLIQDGKGRNVKYFVTKSGKAELRKFGIKI